MSEIFIIFTCPSMNKVYKFAIRSWSSTFSI